MHVFLIEDSERHHVIAEDEEDAMKVFVEAMGEIESEKTVTRLDDGERLVVRDDDLPPETRRVEKTCREWVEKEGRGLLCSSVF